MYQRLKLKIWCANTTELPKLSFIGVEIPNTNGRAGMAAITLADGEELNDADLTEMVTVFKKCLPTYAVPVFLRVQKKVETTGTFKYQKNKLKEKRLIQAKLLNVYSLYYLVQAVIVISQLKF